MTDSSIIQDARDVLAKWRATPKPRLAMVNVMAQALDTASDARLIVGTAGNPELLDAIDLVLLSVIGSNDFLATEDVRRHARRLAAAIIAANERMSA